MPGTESVRWWDGGRWRLFRVNGDRAGVEPLATEPPSVGYAFGALLIVFGAGSALLTLKGIGAALLPAVFFGALGILLLPSAFWSSRCTGAPPSCSWRARSSR
ncbi:MAG: hypothetical protein QM607_04060 [Microbacterium sp.]